MSLTVHLAEDIEQRLQEESKRLDEPVDSVIHRILDSALPAPAPVRSRFVVKPLDLQVHERWNGLTPSEILEELDIEEYKEKLERARHESSDLCL